MHHDRGRAGHEHRPQRRAGGRLPRHRAGDDRRPPVRLGPAGHPLRGPGRHVGRHGHRDRRRGRVDEPGADRLDHRPRARRGLRAHGARPLRVHPPGPVRRGDRPALGHRARRDGRLRPAVAPARGARPGRGALRPRARAPALPGPDGDDHHRGRRGRAPRHEHREARRPGPRLRRGRTGDGGDVVADLGRGRSRSRHERGARRGPWACAPGPASTPSRWRPTTR